MKNYFVLILKYPDGKVCPSAILYAGCGLQDVIVRQSSLGVKILDVKVIEFNSADYV